MAMGKEGMDELLVLSKPELALMVLKLREQLLDMQKERGRKDDWNEKPQRVELTLTSTAIPTTSTTASPSPFKPRYTGYDNTSSPEMEEFVETSQIIRDHILAKRMTRFPSPPLSDREEPPPLVR